jgi:hypothetical protein
MALTAYDEWTDHVRDRFLWLWGRQIDEHLRLQPNQSHDDEFAQFKRALAACCHEEE